MKQYEKPITEAVVGFTHIRELKNSLGQASQVVQVIKELEENKKIVIETKTKFDVFTTSYLLSEYDQTTLTYEEKYNSEKISRNLNHMIMGFIYKKRINKKTEYLFNALESLIDSV
jgi:hypothetical protein